MPALRILAPGTAPDLVAELQRLRGAVFIEDGIDVPLIDGRHVTPDDARSWHLVVGDPIEACLRYLVHDPPPVTVGDLTIRSPAWPLGTTSAVYADMDLAAARGWRYVEVGLWCVTPARRGSPDSLRLIRGAYSLSKRLGGAIGITAANLRHGASTIMQRLGGRVISAPYFDSRFNATVELVRFECAP